MNDKKIRPVICVITTQAADEEQRRYLMGIIDEAQKYGYDTAVISNIYNPIESSEILFTENRIYEFIGSPDIDAFILISESFANVELRRIVLEKLSRHKNKPIVALGALLPEFVLPEFIHIDTDDESDFEDITDHLIDRHGFTDIDILTGHRNVDVSHIRVKGYERSLKKHSIVYDEEKVHFGDFWMTSGKDLAQRYIKKEIHMPQAVICTNDYMAYGMIDEFFENGIAVPEDISVVGFENVGDRLDHFPILTTFKRNRENAGRTAVQIVHSKLTDQNTDTVFDLHGTLMCGNSCKCGVSNKTLIHDLKASQNEKMYYFLSLFSQMDQKLTECRSVSDFIKVLKDFIFLNRNVSEIYLCLLEKWYEENSESSSASCFKVISSDSTGPEYMIGKYSIAEIFSENDKPAAYYLNPLFFADKILGFTILQYNCPDCFDHIFRNWLKSVSNALEFLRMKNDIRYLTQCQNISTQYDSLTGIYNMSGFEDAVNFSSSALQEGEKLVLILLKTELFSSGLSIDKQNSRMSVAVEIADVLKNLSDNRNSISGRINHTTYAYAFTGRFEDETADFMTDKLSTFILHKTNYIHEFGMDSFLCASKIFSNSCKFNFKYALSELSGYLSDRTSELLIRRSVIYYKALRHFRDSIYLEPYNKFSPDDVCRKNNIGTAYFRHVYSGIFGISFNQDCIAARMSLAKYFLLSTSFDINCIADKCGYDNPKYFMRLFQKNFSVTPTQYRERAF